MPRYQGICSSCGYEEEVVLRMSDTFPSICPHCGEKTFSQDYSALAGVSCYGPSNESIGSVAERNTRQMSKELLEKKRKEIGGGHNPGVDIDKVMRKMNEEAGKILRRTT